MPPRVVFLRVMLWSLALAAVAGVFAVLSLQASLAWRVVGTGVATAVACALMLPISVLMDRHSTRASGLVGMAAVIVEFVLALTLIWEAPRRLGLSFRVEEAIALSIALTAGAGPVAMALLRAIHPPLSRKAAAGGIAVLAVSVACLELGIWEQALSRGMFSDQWLESGAAILVCFGLACACLVGLHQGDRRFWRWAGVLAGVGAGCLWLGGIWQGTREPLGLVAFEVLLSITIVVAHACLFILCPLQPGQRWVRIGTATAVVITAAIIDWIEVQSRLYLLPQSELLARLASASGIVAGCGSVALLVLARMNRRVDYEPTADGVANVTLLCPRCATKQTVAVGDSRCVRCGLRIFLRIEDPRCPRCNYLLYGLTADRCPECGTVIAPTDRPEQPAATPT